MAFPTVEGTAISVEAVDTATHDIAMPAITILADDIILVGCAVNGNPTITNPAGYTKLVDSPNSVSTTKLVVFYKRAAGGEGATTYSTGAASEQSANRTWVIRGAHTTSAPEAGTSATGASTAPNPPLLNPAGWDVEDALWFALSAHVNGTTTVSTAPTSYTNLTSDVSASAGAANAVLGAARRQNTVASEDPGAFALSGATSRSWAANTVAIRPAPAGTTHQGSAAIAGTAALAAAAKRVALGSAAITGLGTLAGAGRLIGRGQAAIAGASTVAPNGRLIARSGAALVGSGSLLASGVRVQRGSLQVAGTSQIAALGRLVIRGGVLIEGTSTLIATPAGGANLVRGSAAILGTSSVQAVALRVALGSASIAGLSTLQARALRVALAQASIAGTSNLAVVGKRVALGSAAIEGTSELQAIARAVMRGSVVVVGTGALTANGSIPTAVVLLGYPTNGRSYATGTDGRSDTSRTSSKTTATGSDGRTRARARL